MAGISRLHTEAAVMTPAVKPKSSALCLSFSSCAKKKTSAAPSALIMKIKPVPQAASLS